MTPHQLTISAHNQPALLERIFRVIRHRGFTVDRFTMEQIDETQSIDIEAVVSSERAIEHLFHQLDKLWDVTHVEVKQPQAQQISA